MERLAFWFFPALFGLLWTIGTVYLVLAAAGSKRISRNPRDVITILIGVLHAEILLLATLLWPLEGRVSSLQADVAVIKKMVESIAKSMVP